ncbi:immunoglobulin superfamily DCC subclass member 3 [Micropterus dolomieu]|uniref:immunoglobulin superfamily DCC subclass member 3 n=1 Tax=Micropterus dolomieu TaxID=147949 RepID=UPI001E8E33D0|nr:immunoglobulin superfamily DCC subclass member 3 [Micropterus dolomieu]
MKPRIFLTCLAAFYCLSGCLASELSFLLEPSDVIAVRERPLMLDCRVQGEEPIMVTWRKNGLPLPTSPRIWVLANGTLFIQSFQKRRDGSDADMGEYDCAAQNRYGMLISRKAKVLLASLPKFHTHPVSMSVDEGGVARFQCQINGVPEANITWERNRVTLNTTDNSYFQRSPPEFLQWPQSVSKPAGGSAVFTCVAQGVPEPHLIWLKNGKVLIPGHNVKLTNNNSTLALTRISSEDEAIYQCIAENSAGTNQASARLAVAQAKDLPGPPQDLTASILSTNALQVTWSQPPANITDSIIGYVLHIRKIGEPDSLELQEAISKDTFQHDVTNLEPATTYSLYLKAYSPLGASQQSRTVVATTLGGVPTPPMFFTKLVNSSTVQVLWELPNKAGMAEGFRLSYRRVPHAVFQGPIQLPCHINAHTISKLEPGGVYEVKLLAYNGNGESDCSKRLVSLAEEGMSDQSTGGSSLCQCRDGEASLGSIVIGIHIGTACIIFCVLFLMFGYRRSLFCSKGTQDNWSVPRDNTGHNGIHKDGANRQTVESVPQVVCPGQCQVVIEQHLSGLLGTDTG